LVRVASLTASPAILVDWVTWRPISATDEESSSVAVATVCTLAEACSAAAATVVAWALVSSAVADMLCEVARISVAAEASVSSEPRTPLSKVAI
jgi:hypothetical protein